MKTTQKEKLINMIASGVNDLHNNYPHIDKLNVFPVPDGDTGTNMNLTATNGFNEIKDAELDSIGQILATFSRGLIMGARGNSGVIFSQIVKGLSQGMKNSEDLSPKEWKKGLNAATEIAYKAVMKPIEGTILTVIRETSEQANKLPDDMDVKEFWKKIVQYANQSLENTPNLLKALKDVGVVDSGGYGLVKFLEGIANYVINDKVTPRLAQLETNEGGNLTMDLMEKEFGYCTETIVLLRPEWVNKLQVNTIRDQLQLYGNTSSVVVIDDDILKVHTHALNPGQVLIFLQQYGDFQTVKVENMNLQAERQVTQKTTSNKMPKWTENSKITPKRSLANEQATIAVVASEQLKYYFENELGIDLAIDGGSMMNPSTNDFLKAIEQVDAKSVLIMPNNSNVLLTARQAEKEEHKSKVFVIPTKTIQQGMASALNFDPSASPQKNNTNLTRAIKSVTSFNISQAAKDSVVDGVTIKKDDYMGIVDGHIMMSVPSLNVIFEKCLSRYITNRTEIITVFTGQESDAKSISDLRKYLDENYDIEYEIIEGGQKIFNFLISIE
ncbi:hypothetical protein JN01_0334 [Entomoplasma freundtii]|uniref:Dihydroxyacetone/glyceraldehyde kinase n=1 Tax=Entomoplasma freundtii TaxID=74700 RepID=A0A2K8NR42_9MOLU|nr:DAK2 domain-containing protein [Entomoplasma freundtii]ATZ16254.1 dihydroxyacetone/glyceraldehyde kinase [Entomoplasma freundtii]TDY56845.1 hypothetical protein JN01_0334 [Entomoplasma freundtii]